MNTAQKIKLSNENFFSKCDQLQRRLPTSSNSLKKSLMENFICAVSVDMKIAISNVPYFLHFGTISDVLITAGNAYG